MDLEERVTRMEETAKRIEEKLTVFERLVEQRAADKAREVEA